MVKFASKQKHSLFLVLFEEQTQHSSGNSFYSVLLGSLGIQHVAQTQFLQFLNKPAASSALLPYLSDQNPSELN